MVTLSLNTPTLLTIIRLVSSPTVVPFLFISFLPYNSFIINFFVAIFFILLSLTDLLDGYLARSYNQVTILGKLLDPIADKFLLYCSLITLVYLNKIYFYWAILLIGREFFVMGLREIALSYNFNLSVTRIAKYKTATLTVYIASVVINPTIYNSHIIILNSYTIIECFLLLIALLLSFISAYDYYVAFIKKYKAYKKV